MSCRQGKQWKHGTKAIALLVAFCLTACRPADDTLEARQHITSVLGK